MRSSAAVTNTSPVTTGITGAARCWSRLAIAATLAAGALVGVAWAAGFGEVARHLAHPRWIWFLLALAGTVVSYFGYLVAYRELARADKGPNFQLRHAGAAVATGFGVFMPRGGFAVDHEVMCDAGFPPREAAVRVRGLSVLEYAILAPAAFGAALFLLVEGIRDRGGVQLSWIVGVPVGTAVTLVLLRHRIPAPERRADPRRPRALPRRDRPAGPDVRCRRAETASALPSA